MLRQLIREIIIEKFLSQVTDIEQPKFSREDFVKAGGLNYSPSMKDVTKVRREIKKQWNAHADHTFFQDPSKVKIVHRLGEYSEKRSLTDYFPADAGDEQLFKAAVRMGIVDETYEEDSPYGSKEFYDFMSDPEFYDRVVEKLPKDIVKIPGIHVPSRDELSCYGYVQPVSDSEIGKAPFFTFKKYRVTFASVGDAFTERLSRASHADKKFYAQSGLPKRPAVDINTRDIPLTSDDVGTMLGEVVIDNWIIDAYHGYARDAGFAKRLGLRFKELK